MLGIVRSEHGSPKAVRSWPLTLPQTFVCDNVLIFTLLLSFPAIVHLAGELLIAAESWKVTLACILAHPQLRPCYVWSSEPHSVGPLTKATTKASGEIPLKAAVPHPRAQFSVGLSIWSMKTTSTGPLEGTSFSPSCS